MQLCSILFNLTQPTDPMLILFLFDAVEFSPCASPSNFSEDFLAVTVLSLFAGIIIKVLSGLS